ncbi:MAG: PAS domain-containing protein [Thermodesulfobacteriota bacterium]|nr:PAS domain-containing protein [Thermodesulfobacteriota bacterium]
MHHGDNLFITHNARDVEIDLERLAGIRPFVVAADERLTIMWASEPVLKRVGKALGLKLSEIIEPVEPREEITPLSIARNRGARYEVLLKNGVRSTPLIGEWVFFRGGFILLADPDVRKQEDLDKFSFDDFSEDDHTIELLTAREEHIRSLREARSAVDALREKNEIIEEANRRLGLINAELEKEISERKRSEEALRQNKERLDLALQGGDLGTWDWNIRTDELRFNERWATMIGCSLDEIEPRLSFWENLVHPEDMPGVREKLNAHFKEETSFYEAEFRMRHKSGAWVWILDKGKVIERDVDGKPLRACGTHLDITESKLAKERLQAERDYSANIINGTPTLICGIAPDGACTFINPAGERITGYGREELEGKNWWEVFYPGDEYEQVERFFRDLEKEAVRDYEMILTRKDGGKRTIIWNSLKRFDENGGLVELIGFGHDITERKRVRENLVRAKEAAESANRSKSEFLSTMSHEIRTPLNGVMGMLHLLQASTLDEAQKEYVELAVVSGKSLLTVINDILDFSRIEAGKLEIAEENFSLPEILRTIAGSFKLQAGEKGIRFHLDIDEGVPDLLVGDGGRIRQILFNLVGNSMKFTEQGEVSVQTFLLGRENGEKPLRLFFCVSDTGVGIPEDIFKYVFEPFTQADGSYARKYQGTGLGLGIVKKLVECMDGSVAVESEVGIGTTVYFSVWVNLPEPLTERRQEMPGRRQSDIFSSPLKVLVAEDNPVSRVFAVRMLEKFGHGVTAVENGREVLSALEKESFDAVLMDVQMPVMDGVEATRIIRGSVSGDIDPHIPIIAMTAHAMMGDRERFLEAGMDDYMAKPVEGREFAAVIARVVDSRDRSEVTNSF